METHNFETFLRVVENEVAKFPTVGLCRKLDEGKFKVADYHQYLKIVFHQSFNAASTFALAGGHCIPEKYEIRDYLIRHAAEEWSHYQWVLDDLERTGYQGVDLRKEVPEPSVLAYLAFNFFIAVKHPIARLGAAAVLEGIGATHAKRYAQMIRQQLDITETQIVFTLGHSDTDVTHTKEIYDLLKKSGLASDEWHWLEIAAVTSAGLYRRMYDNQ